MRYCVFGSARDIVGEQYLNAGYELGKRMAEANIELVYGAGKTGMMGAVNRGVIDHKGQSWGVSPRFMSEFEPIGNCTNVILTDTMHERKYTMEELSDAFIITAGGIGTYEEFFEVLTLKQLKRHNKPIVILNTNGYYDGLLEFLKTTADKKFMSQDGLDLFTVANTPKEAIEVLAKEVKA